MMWRHVGQQPAAANLGGGFCGRLSASGEEQDAFTSAETLVSNPCALFHAGVDVGGAFVPTVKRCAHLAQPGCCWKAAIFDGL